MSGRLTPMIREVDEFLMGEARVQQTLRRLARHLEELEIDFALAGGLAVGAHGYLRLTVDVDILITAEGLSFRNENVSAVTRLPRATFSSRPAAPPAVRSSRAQPQAGHTTMT